jgi:hypothetical protein
MKNTIGDGMKMFRKYQLAAWRSIQNFYSNFTKVTCRCECFNCIVEPWNRRSFKIYHPIRGCVGHIIYIYWSPPYNTYFYKLCEAKTRVKFLICTKSDNKLNLSVPCLEYFRKFCWSFEEKFLSDLRDNRYISS